jgi:hypothetical protein
MTYFIAVEAHGAVGDGVTDDSAAINAAIAAAYAAGIGEVCFLSKQYAVASTITLGNGSASAYSTNNGVSLVGTGSPFLRLDNGGGPLEDNGTRLLWIGASGGTMVAIDGPCFGNDIRHIALNCNDLADHALVLTSASRGWFPYITASDYVVSGLKMTTVAAESIGGQTEGLGNEGNIFDCWRGDGNSGHPTAIGMDLDGYTGSASNGSDTVRNTFNNTYLLVSRAGGTGIRLAFCDQNTFHHTTMSCFGTSNGNEASVRFIGTATVPNNYPFPQNICFTGHVDLGQDLPVVVSGTPGYGHVMDNMTLFDQQEIPNQNVAKYLRYETVENGNFPKGGYWSQGGLTVLERATRNKIRNARFTKATAGTSIVNPVSGQTLLDGWFLAYNGTATMTVSRQAFTPGQTSVPYEPKYFMRIDVTARSGGSFMMLGHSPGTSEILEGRCTTASAWMKADSTSPVSVVHNQLFGSGGSSGVATSGQSSFSVGTSWARYKTEVVVPSITGKTVGAGDGSILYFSLPPNSTFTIDIALPQWESGRDATAFDDRGSWLDEMYYGISPAALNASYTWTKQQVFNGAGPVLVQYDDDGPAIGPYVTVFRNSASPASNDQIGVFRFAGKNTAANFQDYAQLQCTILNATSGNEASRFDFSTVFAGVMAGRMSVSQGIQVGVPTGGDKGQGTVNAKAIYDDNTLLTCFVIEYARTGTIDLAFWDSLSPTGRHDAAHRFAEHDCNHLDIAAYTAFWRERGHLPGMPSRDEWADHARDKKPVGDMVSRLWQTVEMQAVHIGDLHERINALEAKGSA